MRDCPIVRLAIPLATGIFFAGHFHGFFSLRAAALTLVGLWLVVGGWLLFRKRGGRWLFGVGTTLFMFLVGCVLMETEWRRVTVRWPSEKRLYEGIVQEMPVEKKRSIQYRVQINEKDILLYLSKDSLSRRVDMGDVLRFYALVSPPSNPSDSTTFDYASYLRYNGISGTAYAAPGCWCIQEKCPELTLKQRALKVRQKIVDIYRTQRMAEDCLPVVSALTVGYKTELDGQLREHYSTAGISHVLALSGMHVGIIWMFLSFLLQPLGKGIGGKWARWLPATVLLWSFAFIAGLEASVVRAVIMCMLMELGRISGSRPLSVNTLGIAAFFMLLYRPSYLYDVGFQLSFMAVLSIILFCPLLFRLLPTENRFLRWGWGVLSVSVAAQLGTAPLVMHYFSGFSVWFLLGNVVASVVVPLIILLGLLTFMALPFPAMLRYVALGLEKLVGVMNAMAREISGWPLARLECADFPPLAVLVSYLLLAVVWLCWRRR